MKKIESPQVTYPRSAPIKPDQDIPIGQKVFGTHIYSMFQNDEATKQKKIQQKAYFQELTRQVQEKKDSKPTESSNPTIFYQENPLKLSGNFTNEMSKLPFSHIDEEKKYLRYQKKYEIENHTGISINTSQVFGGVLQRDEALLLKQKKEEQQKEMQLYLNRQIMEKNMKKQEEIGLIKGFEIGDMQGFYKNYKENKDLSPKKNVAELSRPSTFNKTLTGVKGQDEKLEEVDALGDVMKKLMDENQELNNKILNQERQIQDLNDKTCRQNSESSLLNNEIFEKIDKNEKNEKTEKAENIEKSKSRQAKIKTPSAQETKLKAQHVQERAKLSVIEEKLENARKKRLEHKKGKAISNVRKGNDLQNRIESKDHLTRLNRVKTAVSPVPKDQDIAVDSPKAKIANEFERHTVSTDIDRMNLDTAGNSEFIYPDAKGNFLVKDGIDKFVSSFERKDMPSVYFKSALSKSPIDNEARSTLASSVLGGARRDTKPLVANRPGFPSDIFRIH